MGQTSAGAADGSSAANCYSMAQLNAASPFSPAADDVVHLTNQTGSFTTTFVAPTSGTSGHPITYIFDSGAKFSKGTWFNSGTNGDAAIYANAKNNITIDGASVGIIECTANGTPPAANQTDCAGIVVEGNCSNWIIKNLTVQNIYVRTQGTENNQYGNCIYFKGAVGSNILIDGCTVNNATSLIYFQYGVGLSTVEIKNIIGGTNGIGSVVFGDVTNGATVNAAFIHDCTLTASLAWAGQSAIHKNLIFCFADGASSRIDGLKVYANKFTGFMADNSTSFLFLEGYIYSPILYCNVFSPSTNDFVGNGMITIKGTQSCVIGNNTFYGVANDGIAIGTTNWGALQTGLIIKNNVIFNLATGVNDNGTGTGSPNAQTYWNQTGASYDYNVYYPTGVSFTAGTGADTFAQFKTEIAAQINAGIGGETHSTQSTPNLDSNYQPISPSSAIGTGSNFADMSAFYTTDKAGAAWAGGTGWGGGAFKASSSVSSGSVLSGNINITGNAQIK